MVRLGGLFASLGVRKLRLTGGEPLLRTNLADLVGDLTDVPGIDDIALTTNGVLLGQHAVDLHANGLKRVTASLDTLEREVFTRINGGGPLPETVPARRQAPHPGRQPVPL